VAELTEADLAQLEARASKILRFSLVILLVALAVTAIDHRLKKFIIDKGQETLVLLGRAERLAQEASHGAAAAGPGGTGGGDSVSAADRVVQPAAAGTPVDGAENGVRPAPDRVPSRPRGRPRGDVG
jgi:hypothetical protein